MYAYKVDYGIINILVEKHLIEVYVSEQDEKLMTKARGLDKGR